MGLKTFGFYDLKPKRGVDEKKRFADVLDINLEHQYKGFEQMLAYEIPLTRLHTFVGALFHSGIDTAHYGIPPTPQQDEATMRALVQQLLSSNKGAGWAARLLEECHPHELPYTAINFLKSIYALYPKPTITPVVPPPPPPAPLQPSPQPPPPTVHSPQVQVPPPPPQSGPQGSSTAPVPAAFAPSPFATNAMPWDDDE